MPARTFRHLTSRFWALWPVLPACDEVHHVVYMDGLWIGQSAVLLVACTDGHVIGYHLACSENSRDWGCLMSRIAAPDVLVCDGGGGIEKARRAHWPGVDACASYRPDEHGHVQVPIENPAKLPACWIRKRKTINPLTGLFFEGLT